RDEAEAKIVAARAADEAARRKDRAKELQAAKKKEIAPAPSPATKATAVAQGPSPAPAPVSGPATLHLALDAPICDGNVMVGVNDQIILRKSFSFKKGEARSVSANIAVPSGSAVVKVW